MKRLNEEFALFDSNDKRSFNEIYGNNLDIFQEDIDDIIPLKIRKLFESVYSTSKRRKLREMADVDGYDRNFLKLMLDPYEKQPKAPDPWTMECEICGKEITPNKSGLCKSCRDNDTLREMAATSEWMTDDLYNDSIERHIELTDFIFKPLSEFLNDYIGIIDEDSVERFCKRWLSEGVAGEEKKYILFMCQYFIKKYIEENKFKSKDFNGIFNGMFNDIKRKLHSSPLLKEVENKLYRYAEILAK